MDHIGTIIPRVLKKRGLVKHAKCSLMINSANEWIKVNLKGCSTYLSSVSFKDNQLIIEAENSIAAQECQIVLEELKSFLVNEDIVNTDFDIRITRS